MSFFSKKSRSPHALPAIWAALVLLATSSCNLTKDVDIDLPDYERQPVVECYLEPGKPFRLLLSQSYAFFDPFGLDSNFLNRTLLQDAEVRISYAGNTVILDNTFSFEVSPFKLFNYTAAETVPYNPGTEYNLYIRLPNGLEVTGSTVMLPLVPIDSIKIEFSEGSSGKARVLTYISDDPTQENHYRRMLNYSSLDSVPVQDFIFPDRTATNGLIAFGTGYELLEGDTVFNTVFHISREYYDFIESLQLAVLGNVNPFAQPSPIKSNVQGSADPIGIFTGLSYVRDTTIIAR